VASELLHGYIGGTSKLQPTRDEPGQLETKIRKLIERVQAAEQKLEKANSEHEKELCLLSKDLASWKERAHNSEAERQRLAKELTESENRALQAEGQTGGVRPNTPPQMSPRVTVYLKNPSDSYIKYSYTEAGRRKQDWVAPGELKEVDCLVNQFYKIDLESGGRKGWISERFLRDNRTLFLPDYLDRE